MSETIHYILVRRDLPFGTTLAMVAHAGQLGGFYSTVAVLGVRNERQLEKWCLKLADLDVLHEDIQEPDAPWNGALMAISVGPGYRDELSPHFRDLAPYYEFEGPTTTSSGPEPDLTTSCC